MRFAAPPHVVNVDTMDQGSYRLASVEAVRAPEGCAGPDWFVYRISQGTNAITGYRRGSSESVHAEAETIVIALNERREWRKRKPVVKGRRPAAAARVGGAE